MVLISVNFNVTNQMYPVLPVKKRLKYRVFVADQPGNLIASFAMYSGSVLSPAGKCLTVEYTPVALSVILVSVMSANLHRVKVG